MESQQPDEPCYVISVVSRMVSLHPQTLRYYERVGLIVPARSTGNVRLYSPNDIERLRKICRLTAELGVNLAGVEVIMRLTDTIERLQNELRQSRVPAEAQTKALLQESSQDATPASSIRADDGPWPFEITKGGL
jgi:MerR family transcriptional regulator/heat shock protein HspR